MKLSPMALTILAVSLCFLAVPGPTGAAELAKPPAALLSFSLPAPAPVANWTHQGCWTPRSGSPCIDIYSDGSGQLWKCKACGKTGNPSPGKCTKTTQAELDRGLWCS